MCVQESWRQGHITRKEMMHAMQLFPPSSGHANKGRTQSQTVVGNVVDGQLVKASSAHRSVHASHCPIVPCSCQCIRHHTYPPAAPATCSQPYTIFGKQQQYRRHGSSSGVLSVCIGTVLSVCIRTAATSGHQSSTAVDQSSCT